jgi:hypothetical protein
VNGEVNLDVSFTSSIITIDDFDNNPIGPIHTDSRVAKNVHEEDSQVNGGANLDVSFTSSIITIASSDEIFQ